MSQNPRKKPRSRTEHAKALLEKARKQAGIAKSGIEMNSDDIVVTFLFQAFENAVRAAAKSTGQFPDTDKHYDLSAQAEDLADEGYLQTNVSERLDELNSGRKKAAYGVEEEFEHSDFEEILEELHNFVKAVEELIERGGKKLDKNEHS